MADIKQIKVGSTTYNIEPYTDYLPLAGGKMTGDLKMTEDSTSILLRSGSETWYSGLYANSNGDEVLGIVAANPRTHIMLGIANPLSRPAATSLTPAIDIKNGKVGINKRLGTDGGPDAGNYELDVNGTISAKSVTHDGNGLYIGDPDNSDYVYIVEDMQASNESWSLSQGGDLSLEGGLQVSAGFEVSGNSFIRGDLTVSGGKVNTQAGLSSAGDLEIDGDAKIGGQIVATNAIAINNDKVTLLASSNIYIPVNDKSMWSVGGSYSYKHYGPTGTYTLVIPGVSNQVVTSSVSNMGSATYSFAGKTTTAYSLSGTPQGGGATYQASVSIPAKTISGITLTHGSSYSFQVTYTKSSVVTSITAYGGYAKEAIYLYPTAATSPKGTIAIGIGGDDGTTSKRAYYGQTNIGAESNTYEVSLGASGKTYTYLSSPTASWAYASDKRDKADIESINSSLHFISKLQPVTYVENMRENYINEDGTFNQESHQMGVLKKHRRRAGFLAQDVYELLKKEYGTDNYASVVDYNKYKQEDEGIFDRYSFNGVQLIPFLVKAIQEQQEIIKSLDEKINLLEEKINEGAN